MLAELRRFARSLKFKQCSKLIEWNRADGDPGIGKWHTHYVPYGRGSQKFLRVRPLELVKFSLNHPGSETASFGLARHSRIGTDSEEHAVKRPTGLVGWNWRNFCKTQYAALSSHGGWDNFFKVHDGICQILDEAVRLGMQVDVRDDSDYWKKRDAAALRAEVERWNALVAAFTGKFKDLVGDREGAIVAPITQDPAFEHMEAKGQNMLGDLDIGKIIRRKSRDKD